MEHTADFKTLQDQIQQSLISTTRAVGQVASEDLAFQRSLNPEVGNALNEQSERLLALTSALIRSAVSLSDLQAPILQDVDDVENNWRGVVDVVDSLLEKSDICLDEYTGLIKRRNLPHSDSTQVPTRVKKQGLGNILRTQNIVKPQLGFQKRPNNHDNTPWKPLLTTKPHAIVPLEKSLDIFINEDNQEQFRHPYQKEIEELKYPDTIYQEADPIAYLPIDSTAAVFVDTEEGVMEMLDELKHASEIAVDLEHHDERSYIGLVSLMQISTRNKDWIVDTLKPWREKLQVLNTVFADPNIIKVFHGAFMDIVWLQRDLGLYVVGLFDTFHASRKLGYAGGSLAFLLKKFVNFDADKKYQRADWRIRPLPEEMFFYARSDTHFLLYIFDMMRNELIARSNPQIPDENRIEIVLQESKKTSLFLYERTIYNKESGRGSMGWYSLLVKTPALFSNEQFAIFRAVHAWRDMIAREDDESLNYVMQNQAIFSIAKIMPLDMVSLLSVLRPISHSVKSRAGELLEIIRSAQAEGKSGPSMIDVLRPDTIGAVAKANIPSIAAKSAVKTMVAVVEGEDLRSENSSFWGSAFGSSIWDDPKPTQADNIKLAVPLPALSSDMFASFTPMVDKSLPTKPEAEEDHISLQPKASEADAAFTLKRGAKRKSEQVSDSETSNHAAEDSQDMITDDKAHLKAEKKARRAEKKARQRAKKAAQAAKADEDTVIVEEDEEEAFDYSKAESVLHGKRKERKKGEGVKKKDKPFDPYAKSADAPKGLRRLQTEKTGRSHTFKS